MTTEDYHHLLLHGGLINLGARAIVRLTGADRTRYLNGQVTANVLSLGQGRGLPACVTTAKGKLCADGFMTNRGEALFFDADSSLREMLLPRFERYIIADDVIAEDVSDQFRIVHVLPGSSGFTIETLRENNAVRETSVASRFRQPGLDFFLPADDASDSVTSLAPGAMSLTAEDAENLRIERGIPRWGFELDENTLPPEAGLDRTHIDYHKGCYIGQEVISRLKSIGHVNRRLVGFVSNNGVSLAPNAQVVPASTPEGEPCGTLTSVGWSFALEKPIALGYLRRSAPSGDLIVRAGAPGVEPTPVTLSELPFTK